MVLNITSMKTEVSRGGRAKKYTNKSSRDNTVNLEIFVVKYFRSQWRL